MDSFNEESKTRALKSVIPETGEVTQMDSCDSADSTQTQKETQTLSGHTRLKDIPDGRQNNKDVQRENKLRQGSYLSQQSNVIPEISNQSVLGRPAGLPDKSVISQTMIETNVKDVSIDGSSARSHPVSKLCSSETLQNMVVLNIPSKTKFIQSDLNSQTKLQDAKSSNIPRTFLTSKNSGQNQLTLKVLPPNITVKPRVQNIPIFNGKVQLMTDKIPTIHASPKNTEIIIKKEGGGPISKEATALVEEIVRKNGMKIVESLTRVVLRADIPGTKGVERRGLSELTTQLHTNTSNQTLLPVHCTSELQTTENIRPHLMQAVPQPLPLPTVSPQQGISQAPGINQTRTGLCNYRRHPWQIRPICLIPRFWHSAQQPVIHQPAVGHRMLQKSVSDTQRGPVPTTTTNVEEPNFFKVRLLEKRLGAQWVILPKGCVSIKTPSPPLPRKQPVTQYGPRCVEEWERRLRHTPCGEDLINATDEMTGSSHDAFADSSMEKDGELDVDIARDQSRRDNKETVSLEATEGRNEKSKLRTEDICYSTLNDDKALSKSLIKTTLDENTNVKSPSSFSLQGQQERRVYNTQRVGSSDQQNSSSQITSVFNEGFQSYDNTNTETAAPLANLLKTSTTQNSLNLRKATPTIKASTLTNASLFPRCRTTIRPKTTVETRNNTGNFPETVERVVGDSPESWIPKCLSSKPKMTETNFKNNAGKFISKVLPSDVKGKVSDDHGDVSQTGPVPPSDDYTGPVDMYVYLPMRAFKNGSVTYLSLQK